MSLCQNCGKIIKNKRLKKYCSRKCYYEYVKNNYYGIYRKENYEELNYEYYKIKLDYRIEYDWTKRYLEYLKEKKYGKK